MDVFERDPAGGKVSQPGLSANVRVVDVNRLLAAPGKGQRLKHARRGTKNVPEKAADRFVQAQPHRVAGNGVHVIELGTRRIQLEAATGADWLVDSGDLHGQLEFLVMLLQVGDVGEIGIDQRWVD